MERATYNEARVSSGGWVHLFVTVYDVDTYFVLDGQGEDCNGQDWLEEFSMAVSRRLGTLVEVMLQIGEDFDWPEMDGAGIIIR
ncbi:hypothetical protein [Streptomyces sp. NPDC059122]|uniref:hypothetical protein n=1 Tax=Streptomyces sp. NPDC059122 TaxID=3346732 RepID=UPI0036B72051